MPDTVEQPNTRDVLFPKQYVWFVFLSVLDVLATRIAFEYGAIEANPFAAWLMDRFEEWGYDPATGLVVLKFTAVPIVLLICEFIGRRKNATGRRLAEWMVALAAIPVVVTFVTLLAYIYVGGAGRVMLQP